MECARESGQAHRYDKDFMGCPLTAHQVHFGPHSYVQSKGRSYHNKVTYLT